MRKQTPAAAAFCLLAAFPLFAGSGESIEWAIYRNVAADLRADRVDLCENRAVGQAFDIRDVATAPRDAGVAGAVAVTYTLVRYESCEEGAAYYEVRRSETWVQIQGRWKKVTSESKQ